MLQLAESSSSHNFEKIKGVEPLRSCITVTRIATQQDITQIYYVPVNGSTVLLYIKQVIFK